MGAANGRASTRFRQHAIRPRASRSPLHHAGGLAAGTAAHPRPVRAMVLRENAPGAGQSSRCSHRHPRRKLRHGSRRAPGMRPRPPRDIARATDDSPRQGAVPRFSDESPAHAAVGLHRRPPRLHRGHLLRRRSDLWNADDSDPYIEIYPDYDFSCVARWAWAGMRAVAYLYTLPEVDKGKIAISGHSRNGKQALLAAAFDERIAAAIPSSGNTGEGNPWRYTSEMFENESLAQITTSFPHWFHPRLRFFAGREDKLPVDQNLLMAMVAPRPLFMYSAYPESQGGPFGFEQAYRSVLKVYEHFGAADKLWLNLRDGEHPTPAGNIEQFIDFLDSVFGRKHFPKRETWINGYTFEEWKRISGESIDPTRYPRRTPGDYDQGPWEEKKAGIRQHIQWALGEEQ